MENPATILIGLSNLKKGIKLKIYNSNRILKANLILYQLGYIYLGYQVFFKDKYFNYFDSIWGVIYFSVYSLGFLLLFYTTLLEFNIFKKPDLTSSSFINTTNNWVKKNEIQYLKKDRIDIIEDQIKDHLSKKETIIIGGKYTKNNIKNIFTDYRKDLFPNISVNHFMDFAFTDSTETIKNNPKISEIGHFIEMLKIFQLNQVVGKNKSLLSRVIKNYFKLSEEHDTIYRKIHKTEYSFINEKTIAQVESSIRKIQK